MAKLKNLHLNYQSQGRDVGQMDTNMKEPEYNTDKYTRVVIPPVRPGARAAVQLVRRDRLTLHKSEQFRVLEKIK